MKNMGIIEVRGEVCDSLPWEGGGRGFCISKVNKPLPATTQSYAPLPKEGRTAAKLTSLSSHWLLYCCGEIKL